jgi:hypothetical protein
MSKIISSKALTDTLTLSECSDGFWLWDDTRKMNLSMKARTAQDAFVATIGYYQKRLTEVEARYTALNNSVDKFVAQHCEGHNDED